MLRPMYSKQVLYHLDPIWIYISLLFETRNYSFLSLAFVASSFRARSLKRIKYSKLYSLAHSLLLNVFSALKGTHFYKLSRVVRKPAFCICLNKDADQLRGNCEADQRLFFRHTDSAIPLQSKSEISSL